MREFNVTGICVPDMHYMVDIIGKIEKIFAMVEQKKYFTINRGRQYGKRIFDVVLRVGGSSKVNLIRNFDET